MKKYLISGFNTVQDVKLEVGTYTLVAYVKSMHGDVYTFALGDGTDWDEFSIDVIQGQLCKVWLTFTLDKKVTKFKPIANNFTEELPVYVTDLQLTRGNIPVESGASPFDIDQILNDLHDEIDGIEDFTNEAFADGLLNREEKTQLRASLDAIGSIVESVKGSYNKLLDNPFIHEDTMNNITARYYDFIASWISDGDPRGLKPVILWIVNGDNIISQNERDEKDRALNAFNDALYEYNQAEKEVYNDVGENSIAPEIINGKWAFWDSELQEFVPSEFSAIGDDGHSPYINTTTGTWWEWNPDLWNPVTEKYGDYWNTGIKAEGEDAVNIIMSPTSHSFATTPNGNAKPRSVYLSIKATRGETPITISASQISVSGFVPYGMSVTKGTNQVVLTVNSSFTPTSEGLDIYVTINSVSYLLVFLWDSVKDGEDGHTPYIGTNGNWWVWDSSQNKYVDSGDTAKGDDGRSPVISGGTWHVWQNGGWVDTGILAEGKDAISLVMSPSNITFKTNQNGMAIARTIYCQIKATRGSTVLTIAASQISISGYVPYGMTVTKATNEVAIKVTSNFQPIPEGIEIYVTIDGLSYLLVFLWDSVKDGDKGDKGDKGDDGEPPKILNGYPKTQYAIGDSKTIYPTIGWGESIIEVTESKPYLWSRQEIKYDNGDTLYTGYLMLTNITPVPYMAGEWDMIVAYTRNDKSYPIVTYKRGTNNRPLYYYPKKEGVIEYVRFVKPDVNYSSTWYKQYDLVWYENDGSNGDPVCPLGIFRSKYNNNRYLPTTTSWWDNVTADYAPNGVEGQKLWEFADGMELIITEAIMANFAKLDSFVFHKGKMFSQEGTLNGVSDSVDYTDDDHEPNFEVDGFSGKVKMKDADIEGTITGSVFTSKDGKVVVDGISNQIVLKDEDSDAVRAVLSPRKLPLTPSSYFGSSSPTNVSLATLQKSYSKNSSSVNLITIPAGDSSAYQITIPQITMNVNVDHPGDLGGGGQASFSNLAEMRLEIYKGGILQYVVSTAQVMSVGGIDADTRTSPLSSYTIQGSGTWSVRVTHVPHINTPPSNSSGIVMGINGSAIVAKVVNSSAIGSNGMIIATSGTEYTYMVGDTYEVRRGNVGFRITKDGVQKSSNMNSSNPTWNPI